MAKSDPNKSIKNRANMNKSAKGKDLDKSSKGKQAKRQPTNPDDIFSKGDGPANRSAKYK